MTARVTKKAAKKKAARKTKPAPKRASRKPRRPGGRPTILTRNVIGEICGRLAEGESLTSICSDEKMPAKRTVVYWLSDGAGDDATLLQQEFLRRYTRARELQQDILLDEVLDIADDGRNDWMDRTLKGGETVKVPDNEAIQRSRLRVDARFRMAEKLAPHKYGPRVDLTHKGDAENPLQAIVREASARPDVPPGEDR